MTDIQQANSFLPILEEIEAEGIQQNDIDLLRTEEDLEFYHNVTSREEIEKNRRRLNLANVVINKSMFINQKSEFENYSNCSGVDSQAEKENRKDINYECSKHDATQCSIFLWQ